MLLLKYGEAIVDYKQTATGFSFKSPVTENWYDVESDSALLLNRVYQHLHLENKWPKEAAEFVDTSKKPTAQQDDGEEPA